MSSERSRARFDHRRRPRGAGASEQRARRGGARGRGRDPRVLLRAPSRGADRGLPHVPRRDRGDPEAAGGLHAHGHGRDGGAHRRDLRQGSRRPGGDARVHPRQPSARLPGLRQGRRVPAPGPHVQVRPGRDAHDLPQGDLRQADPGLALDRARSRALHPLLPLHALLRGGGRGRASHRAQPRRPLGDRDLRGRAATTRSSRAT